VAWKAGLAGMAVIAVGLLFRAVGTYLSLFGANLTRKEKLFCVVAYIPKATVQAAIGAVPLAAGVASGEVILAVAVLSILFTAPVGAIGIMILGERILDKEEASAYRFDELRERLGLPRVGERLRNKDTDAVWKVIEEKEIWLNAPATGNDQEKGTQPTPAISLRFWEENSSSGPGTGKTITRRYSQMDVPFERHWEIIYDW